MKEDLITKEQRKSRKSDYKSNITNKVLWYSLDNERVI